MFYLGYATVAYFTHNRKNKGNQLPIIFLFFWKITLLIHKIIYFTHVYTCFIKFWVENLTYIFLNMLWNTICKIYLYILIYNIYEKIRLKIVYCSIVLFLNMLWSTICRIYHYILICNIYEQIRIKIVYCSINV